MGGVARASSPKVIADLRKGVETKDYRLVLITLSDMKAHGSTVPELKAMFANAFKWRDLQQLVYRAKVMARVDALCYNREAEDGEPNLPTWEKQSGYKYDFGAIFPINDWINP